jgi:hypothetical protein
MTLMKICPTPLQFVIQYTVYAEYIYTLYVRTVCVPLRLEDPVNDGYNLRKR